MKNYEYEQQRNALIPEAVRYANKTCGPQPEKGDSNLEEWSAKWSRVYHAKMNSLAKDEGLVN